MAPPEHPTPDSRFSWTAPENPTPLAPAPSPARAAATPPPMAVGQPSYGFDPSGSRAVFAPSAAPTYPAPPANPYATAPVMAPGQPQMWAPPPRPGMPVWGKVLVAIGIVFASIIVLGVLAAIAIPVFINQHNKALQHSIATRTDMSMATRDAPPYCGAEPGSAWSANANAYIGALMALNTARSTLSRDVMFVGGADVSTAEENRLSRSADAQFLRKVNAIRWNTNTQRAAAASLVSSFKAYDVVIAEGLGTPTHPMHLVQLEEARDQRETALIDMRVVLNLPSSSCYFAYPY